jgi:hypothetical protein
MAQQSKEQDDVRCIAVLVQDKPASERCADSAGCSSACPASHCDQERTQSLVLPRRGCAMVPVMHGVCVCVCVCVARESVACERATQVVGRVRAVCAWRVCVARGSTWSARTHKLPDAIYV